MDKSKIPTIIMAILLIAVGVIAFLTIQKNQQLTVENKTLKENNEELNKTNAELSGKVDRLNKDKRDLETRNAEIQQKLSDLEKQRADWQAKYDKATQDRDMLAQKLKEKEKSGVTAESRSSVSLSGTTTSEEYWADFVRTRAELEARLSDLNKQLLEAKLRISETDKINKDLSIKIDELAKEKERLEEGIRFKESTMGVMSRDLVSEREARKKALEELNKLRGENVSLKREMVLANKEKMQLQENMKELITKKEDLESRVSEIDNILKEKNLALGELQEQLTRAVRGGKAITARETASVELPPIVVKPELSAVRGLRGEVIAVNNEEKFVVLDLGESSGARPGLQLRVMRGDKNIATVEVIETRKDISAADIKEIISGVTIQEGDVVVSR
jgi:DNA repair exonuclease SbcCD ATPase subunit